MSGSGTFRDSLLVLSHVEAKAAEIGGGVGLLVALPGLWLAPMKVNPDDLPPLVAASSIAGTGAVVAAAIMTPHALMRLYQGGKAGIHVRAADLRSNERQKFVDRMAIIGAVAGVALESVRIRAIARVHNLPTTAVANTRASLWELFGFAVAGAAVAAGTTTVLKYLTDKASDVAEDTNFKKDTEEMRELVDNTADSAATQANQAAGQTAGTIYNEIPPATTPTGATPQVTPGGNTTSGGIVDPNV